MDFFPIAAVLILTLVICIVTYYKWKCLYWHRKQMPFIEPRFPFGTIENPFNKKHHQTIVFQKHYQHLKSLGHKYGGLYFVVSPGVLLVDVEVIKNVMTKDFHYFTDRAVYYNEKDDPLSAHLFSLAGGPKWRYLRAKITPTFTTGKIKMMFPTLVACGDPLYRTTLELYERKLPLDVKDSFERYTTDVIGSCAFGLECNSFTEPESDFRKFEKDIFSPPTTLQALKALIATLEPDLARRARLTSIDPKRRKFILDTIKETVDYRKEHNIVRNDFMQLVMGLMQPDHNGEGLTIAQVAAQAFVFFLGGFKTSSTTMTFCLYELSINQQIQKRVRDEIHTTLAKHGGNITYEAIMEMKYFSNVVDETLRKYPPIATLTRKCVQDYKLPETNNIIEKGTRVIIPVYGLHHDREFFPNPDKFEPDRFNKDSINPLGYMPFGEGPRICIGLRFALMQTKVGLVVLLKNFNFTLNAKTKFPLELQPSSLILSPEGGVWLDIEKV